jgi:hypothetical protein
MTNDIEKYRKTCYNSANNLESEEIQTPKLSPKFTEVETEPLVNYSLKCGHDSTNIKIPRKCTPKQFVKSVEEQSGWGAKIKDGLICIYPPGFIKDMKIEAEISFEDDPRNEVTK